MLARRFTLICLLTSLFGMLFASLVVHSDRSTAFADAQSQSLRCAVALKAKC
jgi:hypothetical protein